MAKLLSKKDKLFDDDSDEDLEYDPTVDDPDANKQQEAQPTTEEQTHEEVSAVAQEEESPPEEPK